MQWNTTSEGSATPQSPGSAHMSMAAKPATTDEDWTEYDKTRRQAYPLIKEKRAVRKRTQESGETLVLIRYYEIVPEWVEGWTLEEEGKVLQIRFHGELCPYKHICRIPIQDEEGLSLQHAGEADKECSLFWKNSRALFALQLRSPSGPE